MGKMDVDQIKKLLAKALLEEMPEEQAKQLAEWLNESDANRAFFEYLRSEDYLRRAVGDRNRVLREERWKMLEKQTLGLKRRQMRLKFFRGVAAVVLPLLVGGIAWLLFNIEAGDTMLKVAEESIKTGSSKAVVVLSGGEKISLFGDTTLCRNDGAAFVVNQKDTLNFMRNSEPELAGDSYNVIQIPRGGEYIVRLEDGTMVFLNSETELRVPVHFGKRERTVWLKGEAYFSVQHEENRTFTVKTSQADVSVLGTEFVVRAYGDEKQMQATLVRGSVMVESRNEIFPIVPGEQARVNDEGKIDVQHVDVEQVIAWKLGRVLFRDARLEDILTELQRWYDFHIFYENPGVKDYRFTMDIVKYREVRDIFDLIEKTRKVKITVKGRNVIIKEE